jgi:hypothetical protein
MKIYRFSSLILLFLVSCEGPLPNTHLYGHSPSQPANTSAAPSSMPMNTLSYQHNTSDAWGTSSQTSIIQASPGFSEEVYIGNQPVYHNGYGQDPRTYRQSNGSLQPGYVPPGTTSIYDPRTGRYIPIRR